ncbi:hypothetical protein [Ralstonia phage RSP15]|uniref:hypothetical protein n=1 Tax=Ralstonia phage RSP15 TaxID=1785960 RepID=UPI00074D2CFE|nr:hypothetical protein BH754_gp107 [Ralstonia phage RSP15]BAU40199.1 hypothetical protein [Ralstonia phage RSP15]
MKFLFIDELNNVVRYPVTISDLQKEIPYISFNDTMDIDTVVEVCRFHIPKIRVEKVTEVAAPTPKPFTNTVEVNPVFQGNVWRQTWNVVDFSLQNAKKAASDGIDAKADEARKALVPNETLYVEYDLTSRAALAFRAHGYHTDKEVDKSIACWAAIRKVSLQEATDDIIARHDAYVGLINDIREARLLAKAGIEYATTVDEVRGVYIPSMNTLSALEEQALAIWSK